MNSEFLKTMLLYYAVIWSVVTPVAVIVLALLNKRSEGRIYKKYNALLDRMVGLPQQTDGTPAPDGTAPIQEEQEDAGLNAGREDGQGRYIGRFLMTTGESYRCNLSTYDIDKIQGAAYWAVKNTFVGEIGELNGEFTALREGIAEITCNGITEYVITVEPSDGEWEPGDMIRRISRGEAVDGVMLSSQKRRRPLRIDFGRNTAVYGAAGKGHRKTVIGYSQRRELERVLYTYEPTDAVETAIVDRLRRRAAEIGERCDGRVPGERFWVHVGPDGDVDACIVMRRTPSALYLGISRNWRRGGVLAEAEANPGMMVQMFADIAPEDFLSAKTDESDENKDDAAGGNFPLRTDAAIKGTEDSQKKNKSQLEHKASERNEGSSGETQETPDVIEEDDLPDIGETEEETAYGNPDEYGGMEGTFEDVNGNESYGDGF